MPTVSGLIAAPMMLVPSAPVCGLVLKFVPPTMDWPRPMPPPACHWMPNSEARLVDTSTMSASM